MIFSYKPKEGSKEHIYEKLKDICVSMKAEDYLKLLERIDNMIQVKLSKTAMDKYKQLEKDLLLPLKDLEDIIEAANVKPVLIFYSYKHDRDRIRKHFKAKELKTSKDIKACNKGEIPIMLVYLASAGHGLNLQDVGNIIV